MVPCESAAEGVSFEWPRPRISSTDLKVRVTTDLVITSSRHERLTEPSFPPPPTLLSYGWQGYRIFFPLPTLLSYAHPTDHTFWSSSLFQFSDHRRTIQTVRGMVMSLATCDLIHLLFFWYGRSRLCFMKHFSRSLNQAESEDHMSRVTPRCLEQFG